MVFIAKKKSKTGLQILPKIIHIYPKILRKREAIVQALSPKNVVLCVFIHSLSILWETLLEKSIEKPTLFHGVTRRIVISEPDVEFTRERVYYVQTRLAYQIQLRAFFIGKFAILEFIPASSPFLSSHRQVRHPWVHTGKFAILEFTPARSPSLCSYRQDSPSFWVLTGKCANPCSLWMNPSFRPDLSVKELLRNQIWAQRIRVAQWELVNKPHWGTVEILHFNEWIYFLALFWKSFLPICQDPECTKIGSTWVLSKGSPMNWTLKLWL